MGAIQDMADKLRREAEEQANAPIRAAYSYFSGQAEEYKKGLEAQANQKISEANAAKIDSIRTKTNYENMVTKQSLPQLEAKGETSNMKKWLIYGAIAAAAYYFYKRGKK